MSANRRPSGDTAGVQFLPPDRYGDAFADVYDQWYADLGDGADLAAFLVARGVEGPVVELGVGSGRIVGALEASGYAVIGLDASAAMLARCREAHPSTAIVRADMARVPLAPGSVGSVVVAFNTLFNLAEPGAQAAAVASLAERLRPGGHLVLECLTGDGLFDDASSSVGVRSIEADEVVLTVTKLDPDAHTLAGQHVTISESGIRLRPWHLRISTPAELDAMAEAAGLERVERRGGWGDDDTEVGDRHVTVYRRPV